jgi:hypothetical protein
MLRSNRPDCNSREATWLAPRNLLNTALAAIQGERASGTANRNQQLYEAEALIALGEVAERRRNPTTARERWEQARGAIGSAARVGADPFFLANWTKALLLR